jgi:hypothetical protein
MSQIESILDDIKDMQNILKIEYNPWLSQNSTRNASNEDYVLDTLYDLNYSLSLLMKKYEFIEKYI